MKILSAFASGASTVGAYMAYDRGNVNWLLVFITIATANLFFALFQD